MKRRSNQLRREQSTEAVLRSALELFVHQGYAGTSITGIAARAGLTKGSVYHYFKDKLTLLIALLDRSESTLFEPAFIQIRAADTDPRSQLIMFVNWVARAGAENKELMLLPLLVSLEFFGFGNQAEKHVRQMYKRLHAELERIIRVGQTSGVFDPDPDPATVAVSLVALIDGLLLQWYRWGDQIDGPALARQARSLLLGGLKYNPS
jgi:TetR/AcrR family acrAB operon transcriptional repressor